MPTNRKVVDFKIHNLTEEKFQELKDAGQIDPNAIYCTPDTTKIRLDELDTKTTSLENNKQDKGDYATNTALSQGLSQKQDIATAVNYDNITNCITEIPQDIKLGLADGAITLKANSKLYQPNGSGVFTPIVMSTDKARSDFSLFSTGTYLLFYSQSYGGLVARNINNCVSGATDTSTATSHTWYDTTNNKIKTYENGSYTLDDLTLPLGIFENTYGTGATSIKNVFNGFGYIGSTIFALPGVKGLIPNGRNTDGTLSNTVFTVDSVETIGYATAYNDYTVSLSAGSIGIWVAGRLVYDEQTNHNVNTQNNSVQALTICGKVSCDGTRIISFTSKTAFHAVDYFDLEKDYLQKSGGTMSGELVTTTKNAIRLTGASYGAILRHDDESLWMLVTDEGNPLGEYNSLRPFRLNLKTGEITINGAAAPAPAGMVSPFAGKTAPSGWLKCDGSAVSRTTYAALFAAIGTTYGAGDGSTTFNLPNLIGYVPIGMEGSYFGQVTNGALPNILGTFTVGAVGDANDYTGGIFNTGGAFSSDLQSSNHSLDGGSVYTSNRRATFDAARYSAIYSSNNWYSGTRVIPASVGMTYCIKY